MISKVLDVLVAIARALLAFLLMGIAIFNHPIHNDDFKALVLLGLGIILLGIVDLKIGDD